MPLFSIYNSDGDTHVAEVKEKDIIEEIKECETNECDIPEYLEKLPENHDTNYWPEGSHLLIEGKIVSPKPKEVIKTKEWNIE